MKEERVFRPGEILHGGDYNPEQWLHRRDILEEDIRMMKQAGINEATLGVFAWSVYEPTEGEYRFEWMDEIMDRLWAAGIRVIMATPSGARPAWMDEKYPEMRRVNAQGVRNLHGVRHNHCMTSPAYREKVKHMDELLAKRYGTHKALLMWHISNELGGECYCPLCCDRFRAFLRDRYEGDIEKLNQAWWTTFWSHRYLSFDQIDPPMSYGERSIHGLTLDWKRFTTYIMNDYMKEEISVMRKYTPHIPITTNFMRLYNGLDYHKMAQELDVISWDSYPSWHEEHTAVSDTFLDTAFDHALMRSMKPEAPFLLMESVPSQVNWHPYNKLKRPGIHKQASIHAVACGSDSVLYFQWRKGRGSFEQHHGAVVDHLGTDDTRVFAEVSEVGRKLALLKEVSGSLIKARAAVIYDWENRWAVEDMAGLSKEKQYVETVRDIHKIFTKAGIEADVISQEADFSGYQVIAAPMLYLLKEHTAKRLKEFAEQGGRLIATYLTGYVDENTLCYLGGFPGDGLTALFGLYSEEIDSLYPEERNEAVPGDGEGTRYQLKDYCERIRLTTAKPLAVYGSDFYAGEPVIARNDYGSGVSYYAAARMEESGMKWLLKQASEEAGLSWKELPEGIEVHTRYGETSEYRFVMNTSNRVLSFEGMELEPLTTAVRIVKDGRIAADYML